MINIKNINIKYIQGFIFILYLVGIVGLSLPFSRALFQQLTPLNLIITTVLLFMFHVKWNPEFVIISFIIVLVSIIAEGMGTNHGLLFGNYTYGQTLGMKIWNVPVLIGINWLVLTYAAFILFRNIKTHVILRAMLAALFLVLYDFLMERPAGILDMWNWENKLIPLQNYMTWFAFSFVFVLFFSCKKLDIKNPMAVFLILTQFVFFFLLNLTLKIWEF